jgi:chromosome segregation ATPase
MTAPPALAIDACEVVDAGADALLRLAGRSAGAAPLDFHLYVPAGDAGMLVAPLPPGPLVSEDGRWSAAFAVDPACLGTRLALVPADGGALAFTPGATEPATTPARAAASAPAPRPAPAAHARAEDEDGLARALQDLADAETVADQLRRRCDISERGLSEFRQKLVHAWAEAGELRELLDARETAHGTAKRRERAALDVVGQLEARAQRAEDELGARREEMQAECARLEAELRRRDGDSDQVESLRADAADALDRFGEARAAAERLRSELAAAETIAQETGRAAAQAGHDLVEERTRADDAERRADTTAERLAQAERELAGARERLAAVEETTKALATSEQALRQELESLTRTDLGDEPKGLGARRSKVSGRAYREVLEQLEQEQAERARLEQQVAALAEQVAKLEAEAAERAAEPESPTPDQASVEADLRHLLATAQRDLDEARTALNEQQARYAAVASEVVAEVAPASAPSEAPAPDEKPWTAVDDDLLSRLQRAKQFAGGD